MAPACLLTVRTGHVADMDTHPLPHMFLLRARKMVYVLDCGNHLPDIYGRRDMWIVRQRDLPCIPGPGRVFAKVPRTC